MAFLLSNSSQSCELAARVIWGCPTKNWGGLPMLATEVRNPMAIAIREHVRLDRVDRGEWLVKLLEDVQTEAGYQPSASAVARMRAQITAGMTDQTKAAA